jgi:FAD binding domain/Berberine and berberine like
MVRGFNPRWVASPAYVQVCGSTAQVVKTVQEAYDQGKRITVRSGGHCYEDFVCENEGGVLIDLSPMNGVFGKPEPSFYCVEGGATLWNVYSELYREYGVTLPGGSCYSVGAGGHFTGGGYGLLSRLYGLTSDYLAAVEVVRVNQAGRAEAITVARTDPNPEFREIAWAHTGGGGGNFGIVTKFWFSKPPVAPQQVQLSSLAWNWDELTEAGFTSLIENFGGFFAINSEPKSRFAPLFSLLQLTQDVPPADGGRAQIVLTTQFAGGDPKPLEEFEAALRGGELPSPTKQQSSIGHYGIASPSGSTRSLPWLFATQQLDGATPNQRGKYKSAYMNKPFPPEQIATMWKYLKEEPNTEAAQALLQIDSYGCEVNAVPWEATAVAQRSSVMKLQYQTYWLDPSADAANLTWIRDFYEAMYGKEGPMPDGTTDGCFVNYPDVDLKNWQTLYYKGNYTRLRGAKSLCDPHDVFHHQQSIEPRNSDDS